MGVQHADFHDEVLSALLASGRPEWGRRIAHDRRSALQYAGVPTPVRRNLVKAGFTFYRLPAQQVLRVWDDLWMHSDNGDVLSCAIDYMRHVVGHTDVHAQWPVLRDWIARVDNWCHADSLSGVYSRLVEADPDTVLPVLRAWNKMEQVWYRRVSITSLIHNTGKNAAFLPPKIVMPMVRGCLEDHREPMQKALGWVLREMNRAYPEDVRSFLENSFTAIGAVAFSLAIERDAPDERRRMRDRRKRALQDASDGAKGSGR